MGKEKENAVVDVDGVCADFVGGLERAINYKLSDEEISQWDFIKHLTPELRSATYRKLAHPDFWRRLEVIKGAKEGIKYLEGLGYQILWATSPWSSCASWEEARENWLDDHFNMHAHGHIYIPGSDKSQIKGAFIIDDKPENVAGWMDHHPGKPGFIYDAPYNRDVQLKATRFTWAQVTDLI